MRLQWASRNGEVDFHGVRTLAEGDGFFPVRFSDPGGGLVAWRVVIKHIDGTFSERVDSFDDFLSCAYMIWLTIQQGHIENAVWHEATERWSCMSSAFGGVAKAAGTYRDADRERFSRCVLPP